MKNVLCNMYMKLNYLVFTTQFQAQIVTVKFKIHISIVLGSNISRSGIFSLHLQLQGCYFKKLIYTIVWYLHNFICAFCISISIYKKNKGFYIVVIMQIQDTFGSTYLIILTVWYQSTFVQTTNRLLLFIILCILQESFLLVYKKCRRFW